MTDRTLLVFGPKFGLPAASPFSTKAMILLAMAGLDYERKIGDPTKAPKKKLPVLIENGRTIPDSFFIRRHLETEHGADFDEGLSPQERATAQGMIALAEDRLYFVGMNERWLFPENQAALPDLLDMVPKLIRGAVIAMLVRSVKRDLYGQGMGRHTREEALAIGQTAIDAFAAQLGDKPFLMGDAPTSADASVYPMLGMFFAKRFHSRLTAMVEAHPNLMAYQARMAARFPL